MSARSSVLTIVPITTARSPVKMKPAFILLMCLNVWIVHVVSNSDEWPLCSGGFSLLGTDEWDSNFLRCRDPTSGTVHGYNTASLASNTQVLDSLQNLLNTPFPIERNVFESKPAADNNHPRSGDSQSVHVISSSSVEKSDLPASPCCRSKVAVFYPVTGFSAVTRKRVAIIQIGPFKQPVVFDQCLERGCRILRGNCTQVYSPQPLYILTTDEGGKLGAKLDFVLVESGCQCQTWPLDQLGATMGVDPTVHQPLRIITGIDFDKDYFAMLAAIDAASAIAGPNQPTTGSALPTWTLSSESTAATTAGQVIDPHTEQLGNPTDATTRNSIQETGEMITSSMSSSTWSQESSHDLSDNEITSTSPTVVPTTLANILPLPELPDHGHPIAIPSGHFNPVLLSIQKFLKLPPPSTSSK